MSANMSAPQVSSASSVEVPLDDEINLETLETQTSISKGNWTEFGRCIFPWAVQEEQEDGDYVTLRRDELEALVKSEVKKEEVLMVARISKAVIAAAASRPNNTEAFYPQATVTATATATAAMEQAPSRPYDKEQTLQHHHHQLVPTAAAKLPDPPTVTENFLGEEEDTALKLRGIDNEDDGWHAPFGESVYTLLYMRKFKSQSFFYSIFIYSLQMSTILLTLLDVAKNKIPAMVSLTVSCAQGVTIFMLLAYMSDLIEAVLKLQDGHYPEITEKHPGATYGNWLFSCLAQLTAGLLLLASSFVLTMQSSTVLDLMLNLTALLFMAEIDDIGFAMAKMGFITDELQSQALSVVDVMVPKRERRNLQRRILYLCALIGLFVGFIYIKEQQLRGYYLPTYVYVQFGDAYNPKIPYFSGILTSGNVRTFFHRQYRDLGTENILLGYCLDEKAWTFSDVDDPCNYFAKSFVTESFDVTLIPDSQWQVKDSISRLQPFDSFSLVARDCDPDICQGTCNSESGLCDCPHDRFGMDCEFSNLCPQLIIDSRFDPFPPATVTFEDGLKQFSVSDEFHLLQNDDTGEYLRVYNMPVYYSNRTFPANIIFFGGRRWILTSEWDLIDFTKLYEESGFLSYFFPKKTVERLEGNFHAFYQASYTPFFFSDPVDFETPDFQATPLGLQWWTIRKGNQTGRYYEPDYSLETSLICKSCLAEHEGFCNTAGGFCNATTGLCECKNSYFGDKCELQEACYEQPLPCNGNGVCDKNSGVCKCHLPWYSKLCYYSYLCIDEYGSCKNGGVCNTVTTECDCPPDPAIDGLACERFADCHISGCANGGYCGQDGKCFCRPPFHGILCNLVDNSQLDNFCSQDDDCLNGRCNIATGICTCNDPASYGTLCEHSYSCAWGGCLNGGTCNATVGGVCDCPEPFFGPDCSQEPVCFDDSYCEQFYGRRSICDTTTGTCRCDNGARSKSCFNRDKNCQHLGCNGRGLCKDNGRCECRYPFAGRQCEYILEDYNFGGRGEEYTKYIQECIEEKGFPPYYDETDRCW